MEEKWKSGDDCYIIENNMHIRPATVVRISGGFCTLRLGNGKGIRVRESRLYRTPEEAEIMNKPPLVSVACIILFI